MRPPTERRHTIRSLGGGVFTAFAADIIMTLLGASSVAKFFVELPAAFCGTLLAGHLLLKHYQRHGWTVVADDAPNIAPADVQVDDPLMAHVIAQSFNTGNSVVGWYDENGVMRFHERAPMRVPIVRRHDDGTIVDGTADLVVTYTDSRGLTLEFKDARDLDGNELPLLVDTTFEASGHLHLPGDLFG